MLASVWSVFRAHAAVLTGLAVVLHFLAWKFVGQLQVDLLAYIAQTFRVDLAELAGRVLSAGSEVVPELVRDVVVETDQRMEEQVGGVVMLLAYGLLMQAAVAELMFGGSGPPGVARTRPSKAAPPSSRHASSAPSSCSTWRDPSASCSSSTR